MPQDPQCQNGAKLSRRTQRSSSPGPAGTDVAGFLQCCIPRGFRDRNLPRAVPPYTVAALVAAVASGDAAAVEAALAASGDEEAQTGKKKHYNDRDKGSKKEAPAETL